MASIKIVSIKDGDSKYRIEVYNKKVLKYAIRFTTFERVHSYVTYFYENYTKK